MGNVFLYQPLSRQGSNCFEFTLLLLLELYTIDSHRFNGFAASIQASPWKEAKQTHTFNNEKETTIGLALEGQ